MADRTDIEMVSYALEIDPELLPFAPELLADLDVLGADAPLIVDVLRELGIRDGSTVVDLGCGKGGVSTAIAAALGCTVIGIELFEPFVPIARRAAEEAGVGHLCRFVHGGIGATELIIEPADAVVFAALGDVLGPLDTTIAIIRRYVRVGGYILINDSCLRDGTTAQFPGFENYGDLEETRQRLTSCGDELVLEVLESNDDDGDDDGDDDEAELEEAELLLSRANELAARHPELADAFAAFARSQQEEYDYLADHTIGAVWAVQRRS